MTLRAYVLRDRKPVHEPDITKAILFAADRKNVQVALDRIGPATISTLFFTFPPDQHRKRPVIFFETMIFGGKLDTYQKRATTYRQAEANHADACKRVRAALDS